ncbi:MAG: double zinc ribbon domain-containing protein [Oscillospiraceae bacterium]|nr:double zinc ribbon domain-containing protein [Oscillospiraceae bacterium]
MGNKLTRHLLDLLYPTRCILCRRPIAPGRPDICPVCQDSLNRPPSSGRKGDFFSRCISALYYEGSVRDAIRRYKFEGVRAYAAAFGEQVAACIYEDEDLEYDILTWVPLASGRRWRRGYDQTELIAREAARRLRRKLTPTLKKRHGVQPQSKSGSPEGRRANIAGAYTVLDPSVIKGKRIMIIDDIITTGSTLSECVKTLLLAGAEDVVCATLASTR